MAGNQRQGDVYLLGVHALKKLVNIHVRRADGTHFEVPFNKDLGSDGRMFPHETLAVDDVAIPASTTDSSEAMVVKEYAKKGLFFDGLLISNEGTGFYVHRADLRMKSTFLKRLLDLDPINHVIYLPTIDTNTLQFAVQIFRSSPQEVSAAMTTCEPNFTKYFHTGVSFGMPVVLDTIAKTLGESLTYDNCFKIWRYSIHCRLGDLMSKAEKFIDEYFELAYKFSKDLATLPARDLGFLLKRNTLVLSHESCVLDAIARWVLASPERRCLHGIQMAETCVRFGLLRDFDRAVQYKITDLMKIHPHLKKWQCWIKLFKPYMSTPSPASNKLKCLPRVSRLTVMAIGGWYDRRARCGVEIYDALVNKWFSRPDLEIPERRAYHGAVHVGWKIYLFGGYDGRYFHNTTYMLDLKNIKEGWVLKAAMNQARCYVGAVYFKGYIYAIGGMESGNTRLETVERYDVEKNQWDMVAPMLTRRSDPGVTIYDGKIYVAGGFDGTTVLNTIDIFDPSTERWSFGPPMPSACSGAVLVVFQNKLTLLGGFSNGTRTRTAHYYDKRNGVWHLLTSMSGYKSNMGVIPLNDRLLVLGGYDGWSAITACEYLDMKREEAGWQRLEPMRKPRSSCAFVPLPCGDPQFSYMFQYAEGKGLLKDVCGSELYGYLYLNDEEPLGSNDATVEKPEEDDYYMPPGPKQSALWFTH